MGNSKTFERVAGIVIAANAVVMAAGLVDHSHEEFWEATDLVFLAVFTIELGWRVRQQRFGFFRSAWNIADLIIILLALLPIVGNGVAVARVGRFARALHLTKHVGHVRIGVWLARHVVSARSRVPASV